MRQSVPASCCILVVLFLIGCVERGPVEIVFTGDVKGRLRPAG